MNLWLCCEKMTGWWYCETGAFVPEVLVLAGCYLYCRCGGVYMPVVIEHQGLEPLRRRFRRFPRIYDREVKHTLHAANATLWENVPPYPPKPEGSTYDRQGILGKSLGVDMGGTKQGKPQIYEVKKHGARGHMAEFGTELEYAPYVIGESEQASHMGHWWTIKDIAESSKSKIIRLFKDMAEDLADFLEGKGLL